MCLFVCLFSLCVSLLCVCLIVVILLPVRLFVVGCSLFGRLHCVDWCLEFGLLCSVCVVCCLLVVVCCLWFGVVSLSLALHVVRCTRFVFLSFFAVVVVCVCVVRCVRCLVFVDSCLSLRVVCGVLVVCSCVAFWVFVCCLLCVVWSLLSVDCELLVDGCRLLFAVFDFDV